MDEKKHWDQMAKYGPMNVIDPTDKKGFKNTYIRSIKDRVVKDNLPAHQAQILDFGCGSGNLSKTFASEKYKITGIDISYEQLLLAVRDNNANHSLFIQYDGKRFPFKDQSIKCVTSIGVFNFILDDHVLLLNLQEIHRVLSDNGKLICTIHTRRNKKHYESQKKVIRTEKNFIQFFNDTGFNVEKKEYIRKSHHPLIYLIQYGLVPKKFLKYFAQFDQKLASIFHNPLLGYVDTLLALKKRGGQS